MSKNAGKAIRILMVDDHALFRESVARFLQAEPGFDVIADCGSVAEALQVLKSKEIDIVLLDLDLGAERGAELLERLNTEQFKGRVLLVTADVDEMEIPNLIRKGISGLFMKHGSPALLIQGIRETMEGQALFRQDLLRKAMLSAGHLDSRLNRARLTGREQSVLSFILEGLANKQIAGHLQISESTVKACMQQLFAKTGVRTRSQLVRIALERYRNQIGVD